MPRNPKLDANLIPTNKRSDRRHDSMSRTDRIMRIRDYQPQDKYRDRRGREHYDNGRYAPRNEYRGNYRDDYYECVVD